MPKEWITSKYPDDVPELGIRVGWSRDAEHVQVATVNAEDRELRPTPEGNGWFVALDRNEINRLIRVLRRARDQAFGKDE